MSRVYISLCSINNIYMHNGNFGISRETSVVETSVPFSHNVQITSYPCSMRLHYDINTIDVIDQYVQALIFPTM